jgi:Ca2+-binding RTX toxin-like protein
MPTITINNQSFESQALDEDKFTFGTGTAPVTNWTISGGSGGAYDPKEATTISGVSGQNVGYLYDAGSSISQQTSYQYLSTEEVTFSVDVGEPNYEGALDFRLEILAGGTVVGTTGTLNTGNTDSLDNVSVTSTVVNPALNGQLVTFRIVKIEDDNQELHFDNAQASFDLLTDGIVDGTAAGDNMGIGFVDAGGDIIDGADGNDDTIQGNGGNDTINAGLGNDNIEGGTGNDSIQGAAGSDTIDGGAGDDSLDGGTGDDSIVGNVGDDTIIGGDGNDTIDGDIAGAGPIPGGTTVTNIIIANQSFENDVLAKNTRDNDVDNWDESGDAGTGEYHVKPKNIDEASYPGDNTAFITNNGQNISQTTATTYDSNAIYTFTFLAGEEEGEGNSNYTVNIYAGGTLIGTTTADTGNHDRLDADSVTSNVSNSALNGQPIRIEFVKNSGGELLIDDVAGTETLTLPPLTDFDDSISGGDGDDIIFGNIGTDTIDGGTGADTIDGGTGDDSIDGGADDDTIVASTGTDTIAGGTGADTYTVPGASTIADDTETVTVVVDNDGDGTVVKTVDGTTDTVTRIETFIADEAPAENDIITINDTDVDDVTFDPTGTLYERSEVSGLDDNSVGTFTLLASGMVINFGLGSDNSGTPGVADGILLSDILNNSTPGVQGAGTFQITDGDESGTVGNISFEDFETINFGVLCFARGTLIKTIDGEIPIEKLTAGTRVLTMDRSYQEIRWIGSCALDRIDLQANLRLKPIIIRADALGAGFPEQDLIVSPQHRIFVRSVIAEKMFGTREVLIPANKLLTLDGIDILEHTPDGIEYWHMLFDDHQIVWSNGTPSESLFTGPEALKAVSLEGRLEIQTLFPEICEPDFEPIAARYIPEKGRLMKKFAQRHFSNKMPLFKQY